MLLVSALVTIVIVGVALWMARKGVNMPPTVRVPNIPKIPNVLKIRKPFPSSEADALGTYLNGHSSPCILDVRSDAETQDVWLRFSGNTVIAYIPFDYKNEEQFRTDVKASSQLKWVSEEKNRTGEVLVMCAGGVRSERACEILLELGFRPVNLSGGLGSVPDERKSRRRNNSERRKPTTP